MRFKKLIFRTTRGNALTYFSDFPNPIEDYYGKKQWKTVYVVVFQEGDTLRDKITRICDSFMGERFEIPTGGFQAKMQDIENKILDTKNIMQLSKDEIRKYLLGINKFDDQDVSAIEIYKWFVLKEKGLYTTLNKLKKGEKLFIGLFWAPVSQIKDINQKVNEMKRDRNINGPQMWPKRESGVSPPSYFKTNAFTAPFQLITDTYGVPDYKEVNPTFFALVTFPFLFGVMFGDVAHGGLMFIFGIVITLGADKLKGTWCQVFVDVRYMILLMGMFATFNGFMYNDFASIPIEIGSSCFEVVPDTNPPQTTWIKDCVYLAGVDYKWYQAANGLNFINTMKMKIAVIFGVTQMCLGITMKAFNAVYFKRSVDFFFEFLPQLIMMLCLFGWMDLLIIVKWLRNWDYYM